MKLHILIIVLQKSYFLQRMSKLDIFNSRNKLGKAAKISQRKLLYMQRLYMSEILPSLVHVNGQDNYLLFKRRRKTLAVGFTTSAKFIIAIAKDLLYKENIPSQYILTYGFM